METTYDKRTGRALRQGATQDYTGVDPSLLKYSGTSGQAITSDNLKPTLKVNLPQKVTPVYDAIDLPEVTTPLQMEQKRLKEEKTSQEGNISKLLSDIGVVQGSEADFATKAGADTAQQEYDRFASELEAEQRNIEKKKLDIIRNNPTGALRGGQQDLLDNLQRESLAKQADIAILGNAAKGRFDTAMSIAKRKVESALIPFKAELDAKKFVYENNKDIFSKAELSKLDGLIKAEDNKIKKEEERLTKGNEMIINALQGKAPQSIVDKARKILADGGDVGTVASTLGNYSLSLSDRLDLQLKQAQISNIYSTIADRKATATQETATQTKERQDKEKAESIKKAQVPIVKEKIDLVNQLLSHKGINTRVGPAALGLPTRTFGGIGDAFGQGQDFAATVQQLTNQDTLNQLLELKAAGGTLGAVSEKELDLLQKAASKINAWEVKGKNGIGKGQWDISEKKFKEELGVVLNSSQALYESLGGQEAEEEGINGFLDIVDGALQTSGAIYSQSGYNL